MILEGDCVEKMREMDEASVDAIVTDPPYGLEFMGKEWDSFKSGRAEKYAKGGELLTTEQIEERRGKGGAGPSYVNRPAKRCKKCGKQAWSGSPCKCEQPEWELDNSPLHTAQEWHQAWATEALRVLKPGGHLLAFGGTRTYHRLACAIEDAGFEIRDCLVWMYGSGFPKSLAVGKAIDKATGAEREVVGERKRLGGPAGMTEEKGWNSGPMAEDDSTVVLTSPATPEAAQWEGWGTALKPAHEPIVLARKPLVGTVAANVLEHGTGALNIDGCRIGDEPITQHGRNDSENRAMSGRNYAEEAGREWTGRWPANVALSHLPECVAVGTRKVKGSSHTQEPTDTGETAAFGGGVKDGTAYGDAGGTETITAWECARDEDGNFLCPIAMLDEQSGESVSRSGGDRTRTTDALLNRGANCAFRKDAPVFPRGGQNDSGGASRFFYTPKSSRAERNAGLNGFEEKPRRGDAKNSTPRSEQIYEAKGALGGPRANHHPTVKPIDLMRWLVRLVTPPGGTVLDPFAGSGTTGIAAVLEGFNFLGIEREGEYAAIARARIEWWSQFAGESTEEILVRAGLSERIEREHQEAGQLGLEL